MRIAIASLGLVFVMTAGATLAQPAIEFSPPEPVVIRPRPEAILAYSEDTPSAVQTAADVPVASSEVKWTKRPACYHLAKVFPREAALARLDGRVVLHCRIGGTGRIRDCAVIEETPGGYGFAEAALKLRPIYKLEVTSKSGEAIAGRLIEVTITFNIESLTKPNSG